MLDAHGRPPTINTMDAITIPRTVEMIRGYVRREPAGLRGRIKGTKGFSQRPAGRSLDGRLRIRGRSGEFAQNLADIIHSFGDGGHASGFINLGRAGVVGAERERQVAGIA